MHLRLTACLFLLIIFLCYVDAGRRKGGSWGSRRKRGSSSSWSRSRGKSSSLSSKRRGGSKRSSGSVFRRTRTRRFRTTRQSRKNNGRNEIGERRGSGFSSFLGNTFRGLVGGYRQEYPYAGQNEFYNPYQNTWNRGGGLQQLGWTGYQNGYEPEYVERFPTNRYPDDADNNLENYNDELDVEGDSFQDDDNAVEQDGTQEDDDDVKQDLKEQNMEELNTDQELEDLLQMYSDEDDEF